MVLTLGTGAGTVDLLQRRDHRRISNWRIIRSHGNKTYDEYVGSAALAKKGKKKWNKRVARGHRDPAHGGQFRPPLSRRRQRQEDHLRAAARRDDRAEHRRADRRHRVVARRHRRRSAACAKPAAAAKARRPRAATKCRAPQPPHPPAEPAADRRGPHGDRVAAEDRGQLRGAARRLRLPCPCLRRRRRSSRSSPRAATPRRRPAPTNC